MQLRKVTLPIRFSGGLETWLDEKVVPIGKWIELENVQFARGGAPAKRFGHTELGKTVLGSATELSGGVALGVRGSELCYFTEDELYTYQADLDAWKSVASVQSVVAENRVVANRSTSQTLADYAELDGIAVYTWEDSAEGVWMSVVDAETDAVIVAPRQLSVDGTRPRAQAVGDYLHVYYADATAGYVYSLAFGPATPLAASTMTADILVADLSTGNPSYDVDNDGTKGVIVWVKSANRLGLAYVHASGEIGRPLNGLTSQIEITDAATAVSVATDKLGAGQIALGVMDATTVRALFYSDVFASAGSATINGAATDLRSITVAYQRDASDGQRTAHFFYERSAAATQDYFVTCRSADSTGALGTERTQLGAGLGSKAFADAENVFAWLVFASTLYSTYLLQRTDGLVVARVLPGLANGITARAHLPAVHVDEDDSRVHVFAGVHKEALDSDGGGVFTEPGIRRIQVDFDSPRSHQLAQLGRSLYIGGGLLQVYDGQSVYPADFHYAPDDIDTPSQSGSSGLADGTYRYFYTYEKVLANGEILISAIGAGTTVTVAGGPRQVSHTIPTYKYGDGTERIGVWRSEVNQSAICYRVTSLDPASTGVNGYVANNPSADAVVFDDEMTDADLVTKDYLYTTGDVLSNEPNLSGGILCSGKGRIFYDSPTDDDVLYFSQERREGYGAETPPYLNIKLPPYGGPITGAVEMDGAMAVFREDATYRVAGPGPLANPSAGGGFAPAELVTSDVGCVNTRSIGYTPIGIILQSKKGIELLGRDWQTKPIGAAVEKFTDPERENQTFVATTLIPDRREIRLLTSSGQTLLYDYSSDNWASWRNHEGKSAVVLDGVYYYLRNDGGVWKEAAGTYQDVNSQIPYSLRTPHIKLAEILSGFQIVWWLHVTGTYRSAHTVRVRAFYDYEEIHEDEWTITPANFINQPGYGEGLYGAGDYGEGGGGQPVRRYQFEIHVGRKCTAVQFTFEFIEATGVYGAAGEVTEMVVVGGALGPRYPQVADRRA